MKASTKIFLIFLFLSSFFCGYKPVERLLSPILNMPVLVTPGGEFKILFKPDSIPRDFEARISSSIGISRFLSIVSVEYTSSGIWQIRAVVPPDTPYDIYRLCVQTDVEKDSSLNAVRVIPSFMSDFYFVHITDTHLPSQLDPEHLPSYLDRNTLEEFNEIISELRYINPEFVLHTGDLIDNYTDESQYQIAQDALARSSVPIFVTAGNHDLNDWFLPGQTPGRTKWVRYYGNIMNYFFKYGSVFFIGLEAYNTPSISFTEDQMTFLRNGLSQSYNNGDILRIVFYHADIRRTDLGIPQITDAFVDAYNIDMTLWGHTHADSVYRLGSRGIPDINTSATTNNNGRFRLIRISGSQIVSHNPLSWAHLLVSFSPSNDAHSNRITATINNSHNERFEHGLVRFFLRRTSANVQITGGTLFQLIRLDTMCVVDVLVDILPVNTTTVTVSEEDLGLEESKTPERQAFEFSPILYYGNLVLKYSVRNGYSCSLEIYNVMGEKVFVSALSGGGIIDFSSLGLPQGFYFAQVSHMGVEKFYKTVFIK